MRPAETPSEIVMRRWKPQFRLLFAMGAFALAPNLAAFEQRQSITLDLIDQDFAEQRIGNIVQINEEFRTLIDDCASWLHETVQNHCIAKKIIEAQENYLDSANVEIGVYAVGVVEVGIALAGVPETGPVLPLSLTVRRGSAAAATAGSLPPSGEHRFQGSFRETVVTEGNLIPWYARAEWFGRFTDPISSEMATINEIPEEDDLTEEEILELLAALDRLAPEVEPFRKIAETDFSSIELVAVARRVEGDCVMSATVSGDVNRHVFGDAAYFNISHTPVKKGMMVGNIAEAETIKMVSQIGSGNIDASVEGALDLAAELGLMDDEQRAEAEESLEQTSPQNSGNTGGSGDSFEDFMQAELMAEDPTQGDNFGLNLVDMKSDVTPKDDGLAGAMFANAFTLTLSGRISISDFDVGPTQGDEERMIQVTPSTVTATVGISEQGGDRIAFELPEGGAVAGTIEIKRENPNYIYGQLGANLETKGPYTLEGVTGDTARKLEVQVIANFAARKGSLSCMR